MASQIEIVNLALVLLGEQRITSMGDAEKPAREASAIYDLSRDAIMGGYNWSFAMTRVKLNAAVTPPAFGFGRSFPLPADCLRVILVDEIYVGLDLTDYRGVPTEEYMFEGRNLLTDFGSPLPIRYVKRETDTSLYPPCFVKALAAQLAVDLAETLTQSNTKKQAAEGALQREMRLAVRANAIELPPKKLADDEWIISRL